jgi:hypothetical protein
MIQIIHQIQNDICKILLFIHILFKISTIRIV